MATKTKAQLTEENAVLKHERDQALWLYTELRDKVQAAVLKMLMDNPEARMSLQDVIAQRMGVNPGQTAMGMGGSDPTGPIHSASTFLTPGTSP